MWVNWAHSKLYKYLSFICQKKKSAFLSFKKLIIQHTQHFSNDNTLYSFISIVLIIKLFLLESILPSRLSIKLRSYFVDA